MRGRREFSRFTSDDGGRGIEPGTVTAKVEVRRLPLPAALPRCDEAAMCVAAAPNARTIPSSAAEGVEEAGTGASEGREG